MHAAARAPPCAPGSPCMDCLPAAPVLGTCWQQTARNLPAVCRLKQGLLAMPSTGSMAQQGADAAPPAHDTPSSVSKLLFTPMAGSSSGSRATGALYTAGSAGPGGGPSAAALRKPPR